MTTYCDVNTCEDCPRHGDDCDGDKRVEHTDLISRADAMGAVQDHFNADGFKGYDDGQKMMDRIKVLPSAEQVTSKLNNPCDSLLKSDSDECKEQKSKLDLIRREDVIDAIDDAIDADSPQWAILRTKIGFLPSAELPKGDLISRADAIERIANDNVVGGMKRINEYNNSTEFNEYLDGISDAITTVFCDVPSADAVQGWIPCSERLPSESGDYLCTIPLDEVDTYTEVLTFHKGRFYEDDDEWGATYHDDVIAWQPLPTPYKGGDDE